MFQLYKTIIITFMCHAIIASPLLAKTVEQKQMSFPIQTEELMKGDIHYYFSIISPNELMETDPVRDFDSLSLLKAKDVSLLITKSVSIIKRPVAFFDEKEMTDLNFVSYIMRPNKVTKTGKSSFKISDGQNYKMMSYFDSDDLSSLPNSRVTRGVAAAKKLDVISQSASTIMFTEKTEFTSDIKGAISVSSFVPLKEDRTLVISYQLWALKRPLAKNKMLKENFLKEIETWKNQAESY